MYFVAHNDLTIFCWHVKQMPGAGWGLRNHLTRRQIFSDSALKAAKQVDIKDLVSSGARGKRDKETTE